jgi:hypothetical protein
MPIGGFAKSFAAKMLATLAAVAASGALIWAGYHIATRQAGPPAAQDAQTMGKDWRWRFSEEEGQPRLVVAASDDTDDVGAMFTCKRGSGNASVTANMDERLRNAMGEAIRTGSGPYGRLIPGTQDDSIFVVSSFSEKDEAWQFSFDFNIESAGFEQFKRTGVFQFQLNEAAERIELKAGLENITKFRDACRQNQ